MFDGNPAELEIIRQLLPVVEVLELAADAADYVPSLAAQCLFETAVLSSYDRERARFYRDNAQREELSRSFSDLSDVLESLAMASRTLSRSPASRS